MDCEPRGRREDERLLTGRGRFTDDHREPGQAYAVFLRSPHAHARIRAIDTSRARASPGVLAVLTARDLQALGPIPFMRELAGRDGRAMMQAPRPVMPSDRVRHVGEALALVVGDSPELALDALERIDCDLEPMAAVTSVAAALAPDAAQVWPHAPGNLCLDWEVGDEAATRAAFARASAVVDLRLTNNRVVGNAMEPRAAVASFDPVAERFTLTTGSQGVGVMRQILAEEVLKIRLDRLRVISPDVGGGFGVKTQPYPEYAAILLAARQIGRPVKWTATRSEGFLADNHARDSVIDGALALDAAGRFVAMRVSICSNVGAYPSAHGPSTVTRNTANCLAGVYTTPAMHLRVRLAFTHTAPLGPYRGAGRPEASYVIERLVDEAARSTGADRIDLRRRNLVAAEQMPYATPIGPVYDSGDFSAVLDRALHLADWNGFETRRTRARAEGRLRGIGLACFAEIAAGPGRESAAIQFEHDATVTVLTASQSQGQGHETVLARLAAGHLGLPFDRVRVLQGDSDRTPPGGSTTGSRTTVVCGAAIVAACAQAITHGRRAAAEMLEAAVADVDYDRGRFRVRGTDLEVGLLELTQRGRVDAATGDEDPVALDARIEYATAVPTFPNGCHVCEVEIDPETGVVAVVRYCGVDDAGHVLDERIAGGQIHGGVAQGLGQALLEQVVYDRHGQLQSGSLLDYALPRAADVPGLRHRFHAVPCTTNALGVKGVGESGTIGALPAVSNAVVDALRHAGILGIELPATPERVWKALHHGRGRVEGPRRLG